MDLGRFFKGLPSLQSDVIGLLGRYYLNNDTFTEIDYRNSLGNILDCALNVSAVRLSLPVQLISKHCRAATMILGNSFEALAQRPEESETLKILVLENLTDTTVCSLWRNPRDVKNIIGVFTDLKHLVVSLRLHDHSSPQPSVFEFRFWEMVGKAEKLESLCLTGQDLDGNAFQTIKPTTQRECTFTQWCFMSLPSKPLKTAGLSNLTSLELGRVETWGCNLLSLFRQLSSSLRELRLDQVWLKTAYPAHPHGESERTLWIGLPNERPQSNHRWIATALREMNLKLRVCRVTSLGYDQYVMGQPEEMPTYDTNDPCGLERSLDQRFVEVVMGYKQPNAPDGTPIEYLPEEEDQIWAYADKERPGSITPADWSAASFSDEEDQQTSNLLGGVGRKFLSRNQFTLDRLHLFSDKISEGMKALDSKRSQELLEEELEMSG
jgi:hypothetical protein